MNAGLTQFRRSVFKDKQNIIWLATNNGIVKILPQKNSFEVINKSTVYKGNSIRGIYQDDDYLWWGGYSENLRRNLHTGKTENFLVNENNTVPFNFLKDHKGNLWLGTTHTLYYEYLPKEDRFLKHPIPEYYSLLFQNRITKNYWVGTQNGWFTGTLGDELIRFPLPENLKNVYVRQFYQNNAGVWVVTANGLFLLDGQSEKLIKQYTINDGLSSNNLNYIYQDADDIYWIGTKDAGLLRWDRNKEKFKRFTKDNYLVNNNIYCIYEDEFNRLWLPSDEGLMCFDKTTFNVRVFLEKDGIAHKEFNTYSYFQAKDSTLFFGGIEGITKFHPKNIGLDDNFKIPLHLNKVQILAKDDSDFRDETAAYSSAQKIELSPQDRSLELKPSLLDYKSTGAKQFAYSFNNQQWTYTNDKTISIMNPSYGHYKLSIKGKTTSGEWSDVLEVPLHVKAPFYQQTWFWVMASLLAAGLLFLFARQRINRLEKDRTRLENEVKKRTAQIEQDKEIIEKQAGELLELDEAKTRFFSNITHEFRTPLTLVTGPVEQVLAEKPPENIRQPLKGVLKNARSLLGLINQLLDIAKLESAQMKLDIAYGDIVEYTKNLVLQFKPLATSKQIELIYKSDKQIWKTYFDEGKWTKIVSNLISNSIKFTPNNGQVYIHLSKIQINEKDTIQLVIKDSGQGISPDYLPKIFDRFYRSSDHSHTIGGTGIGLALVKELVELQQGEILVESQLDKGTEFSLRIPVAQQSEAVQTTVISPHEVDIKLTNYEQNDVPVEVQSNNEKKLELLIIEDNAEMRQFIRSCVDEQHYYITEAADGEAGIQKANETVPDLIISDVMMPKKDGFEVVQTIRHNLATSHIPIILLTAKTSLESRMEGFERGADAFMSKPFSPDELNLRVRKLIEIRMMLQARYQDSLPSNILKGFQKEDAFIEELKAYITENIEDSNLTAEVIGRQFGMSRMQLHRKLKALVQYTPAEYVRSIRLEMAMQLLQSNGLNVSEVAYQTGFSSPAHFSRAFKKMYGQTPSEVGK